jgi:hypothetical protein
MPEGLDWGTEVNKQRNAPMIIDCREVVRRVLLC